MSNGAFTSGAGCGNLLLLVDPDARIRTTFARMVRALPLTFRSAGTAEEALRGLQRQPARVVISEYVLPDQDGVTFLRDLQTHFQPPPTCVLHTLDGTYAKEAGFPLGFLPKPCTRLTVEQLLLQLLGVL